MQMVLKKAAMHAGADAPRRGLPSGVADGAPDLESQPPSAGSKSGKSKTPGLSTSADSQKMFPIIWLVCVSLATFQYITDLRATSYAVAPWASLFFELGVPLSLSLFAWVMFSDPGKIPARTKGNSGVEELMRGLDGGAPDDCLPDLTRLCTTTWVLKDLRTKYCTSTGACVREFDHYCVWLNNAIGRGNHRQFILLALTEALTQVFHIYLCLTTAFHLVEYQSVSSLVFGVCTGYPMLLLMTVIQCCTMPMICMLASQHLRGVAVNMTTNEMMNVHRYEHFWVYGDSCEGGLVKKFRNPFDKGGAWLNSLDFWVLRRRSETSVEVKKAALAVATGACFHGKHV
jgi:hypothetical protein